MNEQDFVQSLEKMWHDCIAYGTGRPYSIFIPAIRYSRKWKGRRFVYLHSPLFDMSKRS